ncbi:hypothetical protein BDV32DRAFT_147273 [Aspergillus pseudonomiae]|uniref:Uncharacterized protein n=1 Tax=Aspergillus pseudonomiae TaxID=1506151 RepID=A0A5N7DTN7_9EURO|nr:uncharacterized protein BDV37DRAFT_277985 [Aspergillus pseudonomiae]KAB8262725.1 hypothetical protein BDV32DRAFT_147273 [Aspergillus pseudonomiae]KAE8409645.1 hypothetical protein BDV37DRAFT_277985 [Aspergillus pseudonomiae]
MAGGNSLLLVKLQVAIKNANGLSITLKDLYRCSTLRRMATLIDDEKKNQPFSETIDWEEETRVPGGLARGQRSREPKTTDLRIALTGSTGFLGVEILKALLEQPTVSKIHCLAVDAQQGQSFPKSHKDPLASSPSWRSREAFPYTTFFSNRVTLLSGDVALPPGSVSAFPPPKTGSDGFTASKWATPSEGALNAILRFSVLMKVVPQFPNVRGFFYFEKVGVGAANIVKKALQSVQERMQDLYGGVFGRLALAEWVQRARTLGLESLVASYLEAMESRGEEMAFPFLGMSSD